MSTRRPWPNHSDAIGFPGSSIGSQAVTQWILAENVANNLYTTSTKCWPYSMALFNVITWWLWTLASRTIEKHHKVPQRMEAERQLLEIVVVSNHGVGRGDHGRPCVSPDMRVDQVQSAAAARNSGRSSWKHHSGTRLTPSSLIQWWHDTRL